MIEPCCILVAEDEDVDVFLLRRAFRRAGLLHNLIDVRDGEKAIQYLMGCPPFDDRVKYPFPQLLLLDIKMPKLNGFDVLAWLAGRPDMRHLRVVVLTSSPLESDVRMAEKLGALDFLTKPNDLDDMITIVKTLSERWLTEVAPQPPGVKSFGATGEPSWAAAVLGEDSSLGQDGADVRMPSQ
jgi:CheY-like chemotaxis protein